MKVFLMNPGRIFLRVGHKYDRTFAPVMTLPQYLSLCENFVNGAVLVHYCCDYYTFLVGEGEVVTLCHSCCKVPDARSESVGFLGECIILMSCLANLRNLLEVFLLTFPPPLFLFSHPLRLSRARH